MNRVRGLVALVSLSAYACGSSPIVPARLEPALANTFTNLARVQVSLMGLAPTMPSDFAVQTNCRKLLGAQNRGSGDWMCTVFWRGPDRQPLTDTYDLFVTTDGCYTATIEGEALGGPLLRTRDGREVKNLLHTFEGCFDTTSTI
jgi:hypothetical protein